MTQDVSEIFQDLFLGTQEVVLVEPFEMLIADCGPSDQVLLPTAAATAPEAHVEDSVDVCTIGVIGEAWVKRGRWLRRRHLATLGGPLEMFDGDNGVRSRELRWKLKTIGKTADALDHSAFDVSLGELLGDVAGR
jgi:hypothetical protein